MRTKGLLFILLLLPLASGWAAEAPVYSNWLGAAIGGYDPVAYFTEQRPVKGVKAHRLEYMGAEWSFASAENLALFKANPEKYAPQYGGYCAWAVSQGYTASTDPEAWTLHEGKLYLNYSLSIRDQWDQDREQNIQKGDSNWPAVLEK